MKVILYQSRVMEDGRWGDRKRGYIFCETAMVEDDGTEAGRLIARFSRHSEAEDIAIKLGWEIVENTRHRSDGR